MFFLNLSLSNLEICLGIVNAHQYSSWGEIVDILAWKQTS